VFSEKPSADARKSRNLFFCSVENVVCCDASSSNFLSDSSGELSKLRETFLKAHRFFHPYQPDCIEAE
jgi:hypothetical protein